MSPARLTADERKRALLEAALPLFASKGFAQTTTRELAKAAGVSEPLLYKHFPSKEAIYEAIQEHNCRAMEPIAAKLKQLKPSASTLTHLVYFLMRAFILEKPAGPVPWRMRFRLMTLSLLEDGEYARMLHQNRFEPFLAQMMASLQAAIQAGDAVESPLANRNSAYFAHHVGGWVGLMHLPEHPVLKYAGTKEHLVEQACWFALRGMGMRDAAIKAHLNPAALSLFLD